MKKKLMLLAVGAITALAFSALPGAASAGEFKATCSTGANCTATIAGGLVELEDDSGAKFACTSETGSAVINHNSTTGTMQLLFHGCTSSGFSCNSSGAAAGTITTNVLTFHWISLEHGATLPVGLLSTGWNVTFSCAGGLVKKTITGNLIGEIEEPACNLAKPNLKLLHQMAVSPTGTQRWEQITTTGSFFDLTIGTHASDTTTMALNSTTTLTYNGGAKVTLDC